MNNVNFMNLFAGAQGLQETQAGAIRNKMLENRLAQMPTPEEIQRQREINKLKDQFLRAMLLSKNKNVNLYQQAELSGINAQILGNQLKQKETQWALDNFDDVKAMEIQFNRNKLKKYLGDTKYNLFNDALHFAFAGDLHNAKNILEEIGTIPAGSQLKQLDTGILVTTPDGKNFKIRYDSMAQALTNKTNPNDIAKKMKDEQKIRSDILNDLNKVSADVMSAAKQISTLGYETEVTKKFSQTSKEAIIGKIRRIYAKYPDKKEFITIMILQDPNIKNYLPEEYLDLANKLLQEGKTSNNKQDLDKYWK